MTQALDLTFLASLKAGLKESQELWHQNPAIIRCSFSKHKVVNLFYNVTECILQEKPQLMGKGFRKACIGPWNPQAPYTERMAPSMLYIRGEDEELKAAGQEGPGEEEEAPLSLVQALKLRCLHSQWSCCLRWR